MKDEKMGLGEKRAKASEGYNLMISPVCLPGH